MDRGVIATANELFESRHYPGVVALISDALDEEPECVPLLVLRARAHIALRRTLDAQADLRDIIRLDPQCGLAYRLLGELAARRDENESAAIFFREALRLDPDDREAHDWLQIVGAQARPAAVAHKLPAPAAAAGHLSSGRGRLPRAQTPDRFARGTHAPDEVPTHRMGSNDGLRPRRAAPVLLEDDFEDDTERETGERESVPSLAHREGVIRRADSVAIRAAEPVPSLARREPAPMYRRPDSVPQFARGSDTAVSKDEPIRTLTGRPPSRPMTRGQTPELPGFGEYLVETGILTRERLRAAQAYQRSMKVQLSTAIVTLGLATPQRIEWAAVAHQSHLAHQR